jgi:iron complex outermembrane recepter protein
MSVFDLPPSVGGEGVFLMEWIGQTNSSLHPFINWAAQQPSGHPSTNHTRMEDAAAILRGLESQSDRLRELAEAASRLSHMMPFRLSRKGTPEYSHPDSTDRHLKPFGRHQEPVRQCARPAALRAVGPIVLAAFYLSNRAQGELEPPVILPTVVVTGTNSSSPKAVLVLPESVDSFSRENLGDVGIDSTLALSQAVPNFGQNHAGLRSYTDIYSVRGLGNTEFLSDPAVVLYVDDVPYDNVVSYGTDLLAVERVDVYRGPQGTSFGKNAEAGIMNLVSRTPGQRFEAEARATVASFNTEEFEAIATGPIKANTLSFSLSGQYVKSDGFIRNTLLNSRADPEEGLNGRARLLWTPAENWQVDFSLTCRKFDDGIGLTSLTGSPRTTRSDFDGTFNERFNSQSLRVRGAVEGVNLTSITARRDYQFNPFQFDLDFSPLTGNTATVSRVEVGWSEELRVQPADPADRWNWLAGFFFSTTDTQAYQRGDFDLPQGPMFQLFDAEEASESYALFGNATRVLGNKLSATLGLRLEDTARQLDRTFQANATFASPVRASHDFLNAAPELTLAYHMSESFLAYGRTGIGFKPGGLSPYVDPPISFRFSTETAWASEVGARSSWFDGRVSANFALFYNHVRDYQIEQFVPGGFNFTIVNAPSARTMGVELELAAHPLSGLELSAFSGLIDARLDTYTSPFTGQTVHNTHPPFIPNFNAGVAAQYRMSGGAFARVEYTAVGDTFYDAANSPSLEQSAYAQVAARAGFEGRHWAVYLFAQNLTDAKYFGKMIPPLSAGAPGQPRTIGLTASARY